MIAFLEGKIEFKKDRFIILNVSGVGYEVCCSGFVIDKLKEGERAKFFVYHCVRDNSEDLYGFESFESLDFFKLLLTVNGIGPKVALAIMSSASLDSLKQAVASGRNEILTQVSGIGKKTAERILVELRSKVFAIQKDINELDISGEALDALLSLGYSRYQANKALDQVDADVKDTAERVKEALKILAKR